MTSNEEWSRRIERERAELANRCELINRMWTDAQRRVDHVHDLEKTLRNELLAAEPQRQPALGLYLTFPPPRRHSFRSRLARAARASADGVSAVE